jgi:thiol-disulfide isomerase/thioredoxin
MGLVALGVIGFAVLIAVLSVNEAGSILAIEDVAGPVEVTGEPLLVPPGDDGSDAFAGAPSPVITGIDFDDAPITIGAPGTAQVLLFLASWCPACQRELPAVVDFIEAGGVPDDVELVAVVTSLADDRPNWPPQDWLATEGYEGAVIRDDAASTIARTFGMSGTPFWVLIDAEGRVVRRFSGLVPPEEIAGLFAEAQRGS